MSIGREADVRENNMFLPFCFLLFSFYFISYSFQVGHSLNIIWKGDIISLYVDLSCSPFAWLLDYLPVFVCLLNPGEFLWDINTEVEFLGQTCEQF